MNRSMERVRTGDDRDVTEVVPAPPPVSEKQYLIELRDLVKVYRTPAGETPALRGVNLQVSRGEFLAVIGKS
ncbi:MAG: hypothetical protein GYA59_17505, partial [Chloroflexi bacterium]|nr:hypothetical protein [Chloroflexota bacterium]